MYIYLIRTKSSSILSRLVSVFSKTRYNYVSLCLNEEMTDVVPLGCESVKNTVLTKMIRQQISRTLHKNTTCQIYRVKISEQEFEEAKSMVKSKDERVLNTWYKNEWLLSKTRTEFLFEGQIESFLELKDLAAYGYPLDWGNNAGIASTAISL